MRRVTVRSCPVPHPGLKPSPALQPRVTLPGSGALPGASAQWPRSLLTCAGNLALSYQIPPTLSQSLQEEVAAYLTTQQGLRDGKRRRLAAGMLAQCLARRRPAAEPRASTGSGAAAPAAGGPPAAGHRRTVVRMQPLVEEWGVAIAEGGGSVAAADASAAAPLPDVMPSPVALLSVPRPSPATPHSGLPSRTPKRKLSDRLVGSGLLAHAVCSCCTRLSHGGGTAEAVLGWSSCWPARLAAVVWATDASVLAPRCLPTLTHRPVLPPCPARHTRLAVPALQVPRE